MVIKSIYPSMNDSAALIPQGVNAKLILRHSFRPTLQGCKNHKTVRLTSEGVSHAISFGESIECSIGELHSSVIPRCIETIECMMTNRIEKITINVSEEVLADVFSTDREKAELSFQQIGSLKKIIKMLQDNNCPPGFRGINDCVKMILDYMFLTGNEKGKLDIYCTHDMQLALLKSAFFSPNASVEEMRIEWPNMLEGMFIWGERKNFYCVWRGKIKQIVDF